MQPLEPIATPFFVGSSSLHITHLDTHDARRKRGQPSPRWWAALGPLHAQHLTP